MLPATPMKLNGWQRLWVVITVLWLLGVALFVYRDWPTAASIPKGDVYLRLKPDEGHRLSDYYSVIATQLGGTNVTNPRIVDLQQDKSFMAASSKDQKAYLADIDPDFAKASTIDQNAYLENVTGITGPVVEIGGHTVPFVRDTRQADMDQTARAYDVALRQILNRKRVGLVGGSLALWMGPAIALYALGFGIGWVWRAFSTPTTLAEKKQP